MTPRVGPRARGAWAVILVPPRPGARTRQLAVRARTVVTIGTLTIALAVGAATWTNEATNIAVSTAGRLAHSQRTVVVLLDSVRTLDQILAHERASRLPPPDMIMPVAGRVSSRYTTSRLHPLRQVFAAHRGVDLAAPAGTQIVAPAAGRVRSVSRRWGYGLTIELEHTGDVVTRFAHCRTVLVKPGDAVATGDVIGTVGSTGLATGPHVHFEVLNRGRSVDPIQFIAATRSAGAD